MLKVDPKECSSAQECFTKASGLYRAMQAARDLGEISTLTEVATFVLREFIQNRNSVLHENKSAKYDGN